MLNLFQHLVVSMGYETLKQVQGDIPVIYTQTLSSYEKRTKSYGSKIEAQFANGKVLVGSTSCF
jgi:hypothetical protein